MSTTKIEECLDWVENYLGNEPEAQDARRAARIELAALREAINEALEEAAALFDADLAKVEADYAWQKATPEGADSFDLWNWYCLAKSSAENNAKRIRALKKGA